MSDLIKFVTGGIGIIALLVVGFLGLGQIFKPLSVGTMTTQGTLLAVERNLLTDCIKVSQTTIGESVVISKCVYYLRYIFIDRRIKKRGALRSPSLLGPEN